MKKKTSKTFYCKRKTNHLDHFGESNGFFWDAEIRIALRNRSGDEATVIFELTKKEDGRKTWDVSVNLNGTEKTYIHTQNHQWNPSGMDARVYLDRMIGETENDLAWKEHLARQESIVCHDEKAPWE